MPSASILPPLVTPVSGLATGVGLLHSDAHLGLLDDPQEWGAFSRASAHDPSQWESSVVIEGMHCAACSLTVEDALRRVPGVISAQVSAASHRAQVVWSATQVQPSRWMQAVQGAGYRAIPANDMFASERRKQETRKALWRWLVAGLCMMQVMMYAYPAYIAQPGDLTGEMEQLLRWASWVLTLPVMLFSCGPFFRNALRDLLQARISMDLPVTLGILITFVASTAGTFEPQGIWGREVYFDSLTMFVFFLLTGRWLELRLRDRTAGALEALMNRLPDSVERLGSDGQFARVAARRLAVGDLMRVHPGETFAADGVVEQGTTQVDEALLTGESRPVERGPGETVVAGSHNLSTSVQVRVHQVGSDTRFSQMVALMESASASKPQMALLADRLAKPFLMAVLLAAAAACAWWWPHDPAHALMVAVAVLVVTCPCALSLATPAAMLAAAGALARGGVLVRNLQALESLAVVDTVVFDKTGTLTQDALVLDRVEVRAGTTAAQALSMAAALAQHSLHPVSRSLWRAAQMPGAAPQASWVCEAVTEVAGQGVSGTAQASNVPGTQAQKALRLGSAAWCGVQVPPLDAVGVHLSDAHGWLASFTFQEALRPQAMALVGALQLQGVDVHLFSGDRAASVVRIARQAGIAQAHAFGDCSAADKLARVRALQKQGRTVAMVGDGLNDGPVMAGAHVSFALGQGVPLAQARADYVVQGDRLEAVAQALQLSRRTLRVVRQNLWWALLYNAACVPLAVAGWLPAWLAGLGMATSSLVVVLNALRLARGMPPLAPVAEATAAA
ncbi:heavy metal translocating P-type ATPase [Rhodoferax saidenbachensis]|uniref:ATPase P n=1 Tax=Rhodoferax saidenbachensis TaxID=1484693 RepID=A0A1P8K8X3_9BURK|nr:cation-translocating P-type ATPase [Rhodoferax saidenbachensis]APW42449.1 ATPase P [Rhodoferax saidenbachensis]